MADSKITALNGGVSTTPLTTDIIPYVSDPAGTPVTKRTAISTLLGLAAAGVGDGWTAGTGTWSYSSADGATGIISINNDQTGIINVGDRIKLTQTTVKYFIVTVVGAFGAGVTLITMWGGTDYTLANAAITVPFASHVKTPQGFNPSPAKWTVTLTDSTNRAQATPTQNIWYNLGSLSISIPVGLWFVDWQAVIVGASTASQTSTNVYTTLSTANNSESDTQFTAVGVGGGASGTILVYVSVLKQKLLNLTTKTSYYLNSRTTITTSSSISNANDLAPLLIRAVCAYL